MKRICLCLVLVLLLVGCGKSSAKWQEWYDLGIKYLEEENYEEAIVAFTKAIEIDSRKPEAYVARGGAYVSGDGTEEHLAAALADYETALGLDETLAQAWLGIAEVHIRQQEREKALEILRQGLEKTGNNEEILARIEEIENGTKADSPSGQGGAGIQVDIRETDIRADSVFNTEGYGSLLIQSAGAPYDNNLDPNDAYLPPQAALIAASGDLVFPYQYTYGRYYVSGDTVSLIDDAYGAYGSSTVTGAYANVDIDIATPVYCRLDGSSIFDTSSGDNQIDETTYEWFVWHGSAVQDGYALVIKRGQTYLWNGFAGNLDTEGELHSCIMDQDGVITCELPEEFNQIGNFGGDITGEYGFDTRRALGWCGEGLFAVFENNYDENWNYSRKTIGYMDATGNLVLDLSDRGFTNIGTFNNGLAFVWSEDGSVGFIDKTGTQVVPCVYESTYSFSRDGLCAVKKDGAWGYIDKDEQVVIPFEYDSAYGASDGLAAVVKDGRCGMVDYENNVVVPLEYDDISSFEGGTAYAIKDGILYIISK